MSPTSGDVARGIRARRGRKTTQVLLKPVTTRQPLTCTSTGKNGRAPAAKANRTEPAPNCAGQVSATRGSTGSPQSAAASPRTNPGSRMVLPRGRIEPTWKSRMPPVRLTTTLVRRGMSVHNAAGALVPLGLTAGPPGSAEATAPLAAARRFADADWPAGADAPVDADWPAGTCPQAATAMIAPVPTVTNAPRPAEPSCCIRRTSPSPPTMGWNACAGPGRLRSHPGCPGQGLSLGRVEAVRGSILVSRRSRRCSFHSIVRC
jgi:hypothetical protein